jgi:hypothetical protein
MLLVGCVGCSTPTNPTPEPDQAPKQEAPDEPDQAPKEAPDGSDQARPEPPPLSAEDRALIDADPATLSPEQRRERAHALRRMIMQDPDSPAARTLEDLRRAHEDGLFEPPQAAGNDGVVLSTPGTTPVGARGPAGVRPEPDPTSQERP